MFLLYRLGIYIALPGLLGAGGFGRSRYVYPSHVEANDHYQISSIEPHMYISSIVLRYSLRGGPPQCRGFVEV